MRITLGQAKERLANTSPADQLENRLATVCEKLIISGKWRGSIHTIYLNARYGEVALPRQYSAIEGAKVNGIVRDMANYWYPFIQGKSDFYGIPLEMIENLGDSFATLYELPFGGRGFTAAPTATVVGDGAGATVIVRVAEGQISGIDVDQQGSGYTFAAISFGADGGGTGANTSVRVVGGKVVQVDLVVGGNLALSGVADEELVVTLYGTDKDYMPIVQTITGATPVGNPFVRIDRIHRERGTVPLTVKHIAGDLSETPLAILAATEEEAYYHRYKIRTLCAQAESTITALVKLRFVPFQSDQDVLPFTSMAALELAMRAENYFVENDFTLAKQYFEEAINMLNAEITDSKAIDELPAIRFIYAGGTHPNFTSHY